MKKKEKCSLRKGREGKISLSDEPNAPGLSKDEVISLREAIINRLVPGTNLNMLNNMKHADMLNEKKMNTN